MSQTMRDTLLTEIHRLMKDNDEIYFLTADFGAPILDQIRSNYPSRFINVGVAEQNLINTAVGLAKEGATVFCFAIAPFITMRCYEQIRTCIAINSKFFPLNINLIGVGAGVSYDVSGPTHHCLEDMAVISSLPNIQIFSPSDNKYLTDLANQCVSDNSPKYIRLDSKVMPELNFKRELAQIGKSLYSPKNRFLLETVGAQKIIVTTGYATHKIHEYLNISSLNCDQLDISIIENVINDHLIEELSRYEYIFTASEEFEHSSALKSYISRHVKKAVFSIGFKNYDYALGGRHTIWDRQGMTHERFKEILI